jgi:hypothetical protein
VTEEIGLDQLHHCCEGAVPAVIATAAADGTPNVTYLSRVRIVDGERLALSNQFFSKTARNLADNPRASLLLIDPTNYNQYRLTLVYERTERRGEIFEQLRGDVDAVAAHQGMQDVFKLRAADIYRVLHVDVLPGRAILPGHEEAVRARAPRAAAQSPELAALVARVSRCADLDGIVATTVNGLAELLNYEYSSLLLIDETGTRLYTIASHGYPAQGVGSEVVVGEGIVGMAAARATPIRIGNLRQVSRYGTIVRSEYEEEGGIAPGREIPTPGLPNAESQIAVPLLALGQVLGVLVVEATIQVAFDERDEALLTVVASVVASAIDAEQSRERNEGLSARDVPAPSHAAGTSTTQVRFFAVDGSTFLDGDYLIKGVAGRILWALLGHYTREGRVEFTNKEVRLDPTLDLPEFRDNFDSRLILLKRRLEERAAPLRIEKTGRGRFRLVVDRPVRLESVT